MWRQYYIESKQRWRALRRGKKQAAPVSPSANTDEALFSSPQEFCNRFVDNNGSGSSSDIGAMVACFSSNRREEISVYEHGLPELAPFWGRAYRGRKGLEAYLALVFEWMAYEDGRFSGYSVDDADTRSVSIRGSARCTWKPTGETWKEHLVFRFKLDEDGKILFCEVGSWSAGCGTIRGPSTWGHSDPRASEGTIA